MRVEYASMKYDEVIKSKSHDKLYRQISKDKGTYKPLQILIRDEGGKDERGKN